MWFGLAKIAFSTGAKLYSNKKKTEEAMSNAALMNAEKMARGELAYSGKLLDHQKSDWKDEFVLILISIPLLLLAWSVFSDDPNIQAKVDIFFDKFSNLPTFYQALVVGSFSTILGVRGVSAFKKK